jgi:hypothetical protein
VVEDPVKSGVEEPPELPGEFAGGEVESVGAAGDAEPGEPVGTGGATEVDEDASLRIVNSGLAFPESPNKTTI